MGAEADFARKTDHRSQLLVARAADGRGKTSMRRAVGLKRLKPFSILMAVISVVAIACGAASCVLAEPQFLFPVAFPGTAIAGALSLFTALLGLSAVHRGQVKAKDDVTDQCFTCLMASFMVLLNLTLVASVVGFGISGVWCLIECSRRDPSSPPIWKRSVDPCLTANREPLLALSVVSLVLCKMMFIGTVIGNCLYCSYGRHFGQSCFVQDVHRKDSVNTVELKMKPSPDMVVQQSDIPYIR